MPKELIADRQDNNTIEVSWGREYEYVQLGTTSKSRLVAATVERETDGEAPKLKASIDPEDYPFTGWFVQMSRYDINRLIKTLRKARDQAYGRDE